MVEKGVRDLGHGQEEQWRGKFRMPGAHREYSSSDGCAD
jgi:hypothetical protein